MRPPELAPLFAPVTDLPGVGPKVGEHLAALCGPQVLDLIWHRPLRFIDRRVRPSLAGLENGQTVTLELTLGRLEEPGRKGLPHRIPCLHAEGGVNLVFFNARTPWLTQQYPSGQVRLVAGKVERYREGWQIVHPDLCLEPDQIDELPDFEPVYPNKGTLAQKTLRKAIASALDRIPNTAEWLDSALKIERDWPDFHPAIRQLHQPNIWRERLAYDEILAGQIALAVLRQSRRKASGPDLSAKGDLAQQLLTALPFTPTHDQRQAMALLSAQIKGPDQAMTLVQGDVGSGKTLVALIAMLQAVEAGHQAVIMAPTEILARQHAASLQAMLGALPVTLACLTGKDKGAARREIESQIAHGETQIIVGTHALFQDGVRFAKLGLVVVDEQHRFGVQQRLSLTQKGSNPHLILMSATPIPRTLVMTAYGDLEICEIREKPAGRLPIQTLAKPIDGLPQVMQSLERLVQKGGRAYWICPLIEASDALADVGDVTNRFAEIQKAFGAKVGLIHGQLSAAEKEAAMAAFKAGETQILVATTVIEVGVDVPEATFMVIENAERFGLAQMHQIRGRVGRGAAQGACLLLYQGPLSDTAKQRIEAMRASTDGFELSEKDLTLRGGGEILGTKQSGLPELKIADYGLDGDLMKIARRDAQLLLDKDPTLSSARGDAVRHLLYLFRKDQVAPFLKVG